MAAHVLATFPGARRSADYPGAYRRPLEYPGARPDSSFLFAGATVVPVEARDGGPSVRTPDGVRALADLLADLGAAPLDQRHAVLAVGSNACPGRLLEKFPVGGPDCVIPVLRGSISDVDAVYLAWLTPYAALPATCFEVAGADVELWLTLLSRTQFDVMNASENVGELYGLIEPRAPFRWGGCRIGPVYAYADERVLSLDGAPIRLAAFRAERSSFRAMDQPGVLSAALDRVGFRRGEAIEARHAALVTDAALRTLISQRLVERCLWHERPRLAGAFKEPGEVAQAVWRP